MKRYIFLWCLWSCVASLCAALPDEQQLLQADPLLRKIKTFGRLWVNDLTVTERLVVNGHNITGQSSSSGISSYGQLSITAEDIHFFAANVWFAIPCNGAGPTSNMNVSTTSPATITIEQNGVYQIAFSLYFAAEDSDEDTFDITTYRLGLNINGITTPVAAVYAGEPGQFSLNYSSLMQLSSGDEIQWYMQASQASGPAFSNNVTFEHGYAYLMQIAS